MLKVISKKLENFGEFLILLKDVCTYSIKPPFRFPQFISEIELLGINSIFIIVLSGGAIGMIFALQMVTILQPFQAEIGVGAAVAVALSRELAPVITSLMLIAKNGSAMAAELGTMRVTEQIDALESMSINPVHYLIVPKVFASLLVFPVLTLLANLVGSLGAFLVAVRLFNIDSASYTDYMFNFLSPRDVILGLIKAMVMGIIVSTICCFYGLRTDQGAKGVGDSATRAVVASSVAILVTDYILTTIMLPFIYV
ncbi:MAG: ABC transporter permease [Treponema sp.]|nr:ABC transporter permease [Treponema sp.]